MYESSNTHIIWKVIELQPHLTIFDTKCATLLKLNKDKEAVTIARKMIDIDNESPKVYYSLLYTNLIYWYIYRDIEDQQ